MKCFTVCLAVAASFTALAPLPAESLTYVINWPSGLNLGEATMTSDQKKDPADSKVGGKWSFKMDVDASVPGFAIRDHYESSADAGFCSADLHKVVSHGARKTEEKIFFDQHANTITRETSVGGQPSGAKTEVNVPACARDPLTFIAFARRELAQGRMAPQQAVVFGGLYQVRMVFTGAQQIKLDGKPTDVDQIQATVKGPSSEFTVDLFFTRDASRTPVLARIPLPLGAFTVELMR